SVPDGCRRTVAHGWGGGWSSTGRGGFAGPASPGRQRDPPPMAGVIGCVSWTFPFLARITNGGKLLRGSANSTTSYLNPTLLSTKKSAKVIRSGNLRANGDYANAKQVRSCAAGILPVPIK